jgi:hypothetical protein
MDGAAVSIVYGSGVPQSVVTQTDVDMLASKLNDLTALLQLTRNEAAQRDITINEGTKAIDSLATSAYICTVAFELFEVHVAILSAFSEACMRVQCAGCAVPRRATLPADFVFFLFAFSTALCLF